MSLYLELFILVMIIVCYIRWELENAHTWMHKREQKDLLEKILAELQSIRNRV